MNKLIAILLCLALLLALAACGGQSTPPVEETTIETAVETHTETTTEEPTTEEQTTVLVPMSGEQDGIKWRVLDLAQNEELKAWLEQMTNQRIENEYEGWKRDHNFELSSGKIVSIKNQTIFMTENGKDTVLLQKQVDEYEKIPCLRDRIDERYFIFVWGGYGWLSGPRVYDTVAKKEISMECSEGEYSPSYQVRNGGTYLVADATFGDEDGPSLWVPRLYKADFSQLQIDGTVKTTDVLAGIPREEVRHYGHLLSEDERYCLVSSDKGLLLLDIKEKTVRTIDGTAQMDMAELNWLAQKNATTYYCYDFNTTIAIEVILS